MRIRNILLFFLLLTFTSSTFAQTENPERQNKIVEAPIYKGIIISLKGGAAYQPMAAGWGNWEDYASGRKQGFPGFISDFSLSYPINEKQYIEIGVSHISAEINETSYYKTSTINWDFNLYPMSIGYKYLTKTPAAQFRLFWGGRFSYIINKGTYNIVGTTDRPRNVSFSSNGYGVDFFTGLLYSFSNRLCLSAEVKLGYQDELAFAKLSIDSGSLGIHLLAGIGYTL